MSWLIRRVDALPAILTPSTIYFVENGDGTATQYVTGQDGVARLTGGSSASVDWADLTGVPGSFPPDAHTQAISTITGLQAALDGKATAAHGVLAGTALQPGDSLPWADISGAPAFATVAISGAYADLTGTPTLGTAAAAAATDFATSAQGALADTASQPGHTHAQADVTGLVAALAGKAATVHEHAIADVTGLQAALDGKQPLSAVLTATTASFTTADEIKLDGIEAGADVTDATNVNAAGAVMNSDYSPAHSLLVQQSGTGSPSVLQVANNTLLGRLSGGGSEIDALTASEVRGFLNVADGATANSSDATLLARANHTGTQTAATISDFAAAVAATAAVTANTAKVTNATHTGDVTGAAALTLATVNTNVGAFGSATQVATFTVNAKGLTTAAGNAEISVPATAISDSTAAGRAVVTAANATAQTALFDLFTTSAKGLAPASGGGTTNFLRADGTWAAPAGGGTYDVALGWAF